MGLALFCRLFRRSNGFTESLFVGHPRYMAGLGDRMTVIPFAPPAAAPIKSPGALDTVREYFDSIHATRGHGSTDCGEMMWNMPDGDYFLLWLAERGFIVVPL